MRYLAIRVGCALLLSALLVGCNDSLETTPDAALPDVGLRDGVADVALDGPSTDAGVDVVGIDAVGLDAMGLDLDFDECLGKSDGVACGAGGSICLAERCVTSRCGDGFVDTAAGEECEDGNTNDGDGCTQCKLDCTQNSDCDDGQICNGSESCDVSNNVCLPAAPAAQGTVCQQPGGAQGVCNGGVCVQAGCGNGVADGNEQCDDGNKINGDGCENDCRWTCQKDADCDDKDPCTGVERCDKSDPKKPVCKAGVAISCSSSNPGCTGACDSSSGKCVYADNDNDGFGCDKDCEDADPAIFPGAKECADGKDNDCDPSTPDGKDGDCKCYKDNDGDGFASSTSGSITAVSCPAKYTSKAPTSAASTDCWDGASDVRPNQTKYFTSSYCRLIDPFTKKCLISSWDYNCNGKSDKQYTANYSLLGCRKLVLPPPFGATCTGSGWGIGVTPPACGKKATYISCSLLGKDCTKFVTTRTQGCR